MQWLPIPKIVYKTYETNFQPTSFMYRQGVFTNDKF